MRRGIGRRYSDPVALVEASVLGVAGAIVALTGPWPWLAVPAGPLIALVVLVIATWRRRVPKPLAPERNIPAQVRRWSNLLADDDPARAQADEAVQLMDRIEELTLQCKRAITHADGSAQGPATDRLGEITEYVTKSVETYSAPVRASEWSALATRLDRAHKWLEEELEALR
ncbi:hypothetical protein EV138_6200 [Kribbella voronezhensis]|uniref:Uncharacterized protein n=1 Tax=Kribbella voronezhensis TaxID=2512212 RepID=A0A4R7SYD1_9ACTN|nr:hypothetical protein [Kribbella voronezhensis]TDU83736.1 hypothetical protein EV138_6200 [Kribbella voronezhensis]